MMGSNAHAERNGAMDSEIEVYATARGARSKGKLHAERDCPYLAETPDEEIVSRPRKLFDPDQPVCKRCARGLR